MKRSIFPILLLLSLSGFSQKDPNVYVDDKGVMRWGLSKEEVHGFGINYTAPFAYAYRSGNKLGVDLKQAISNDVYHFARLGFDLYRVHVWDTEISDTVGNLLQNEHLELFDFMLKQMKDRGMNFVLTPIAYWGNGYPDRSEKTPGFSNKYGKESCLTDPGAIKAQENYLFQFLNHVNPYTGIAYKDDPSIIAFEVCNEPHHHGTPDQVTAFINRMVAAMRKTGYRKPIFYNVSHSVNLEEAYFKAGIQGGTFQWYPTGLVSGHELGGNLLPNVDRYDIPFDNVIRRSRAAKLVYEFDAADVGRSYIYPAMARSFREAGIQIATHFAYDPTFLAWSNTEYNTHFMNLVYAPQKALSLMLAGEVFHNIPLYESFDPYPADTHFGNFRVSYEEDLAEMVTDSVFIYTNNTQTAPPAPGDLFRIAGFGRSPVVRYDGAGAYFLDRIEDGVWRLEVMPDAVWVKDPFGRNNLDDKVAVVRWHDWPITINLPDLGPGFSVRGLNNGNALSLVAQDRTVGISPGTYLVMRKGVTTGLTPDSKWMNIRLGEFVAPVSNVDNTYVIHKPESELTEDSPLTITATIVGPADPGHVELNVYSGGFRPKMMTMERTGPYSYTATLPEGSVVAGFLRYDISVEMDGKYRTYPSGEEGRPSEWGYPDKAPYVVRVVPRTNPVYLFDAIDDADALSHQWLPGSRLVPSDQAGRAEYQVNVENLARPDSENPFGEKHDDYSMRFFFGEKVAGRIDDLKDKNELVFHGHALNNKPCVIQLTLITRYGDAYGADLTVSSSATDYSLPLELLKQVSLVTLPRPYPTFLPYYFDGGSHKPFDLADVETLQISIGPGIPMNELDAPHGIAIESVRLK